VGHRIAIVQSNYIPWKGYFDLIASVDEFVLYDDVQYTRRDWRNRNRIKTPSGPQWLSIPVASKGKYLEAIKDITVSEPDWSRRHWQTLLAHYSRAAGFAACRDPFEEAYRGAQDPHLSVINRRLIEAACGVLGIGTRLSWSMDYPAEGERSQRLLGICRQAGATEYLSGPSARAYLDEALFASHGIAVSYMDYSGYPEYPQLHPPFVHEVTVLDLIFNLGPRARDFMLARR
jgi:hypothetical protein